MLTSEMNLKFNSRLFFVLFMLLSPNLEGMANVFHNANNQDSTTVTLTQESAPQIIDHKTVVQASEPVKLSSRDKRQMLQLMNVDLSYQERLKQMVDGAIQFDKQTSFNLFQYVDWTKEGLKNNFVYEYIAFKPAVLTHFKFQDSLFSISDPRFIVIGNTTSINPHQSESWNALAEARSNVFRTKPNLVVCHWDNLPDPPAMVDTVFLPLINVVDLGYDLARSYVEKDHKIEGFTEEKSPWTYKGLSSLHTTETLVSNWTKGGQNSVSILSVTNFSADYQMKDLKWENDFEVKLGALFYSEEDEGKTTSKIQKNADEFKINSKLGYRAFKTWYYTGALDINSQFFDGEDKKGNVISGFLSPVRVYLAAGMDYKYKKRLSLFISPLTYKNTLVVDDDPAVRKKYGLAPDERSKKEVGGYVRATLKWPINPDLSWNSKIYLFSNYTENPQNLDVDFENVLDYNFSHVFSLRFFVHLRYDDDTKFQWTDKDGNERNGPRLQFKQQMSIGLFYRF